LKIVYITIAEKSYGESTAEFSIRSDKEENINFISKKLIEWFLETKAEYNFMAKISSSWLSLCFTLLVVFIVNLRWGVISKIILNVPKLSEIETFNIVILTLFTITYIISYPIKKLRDWLFPETFFLLGKQKKAMKKIQNIRTLIFIIIGLGVVVNVLGNLFSK